MGLSRLSFYINESCVMSQVLGVQDALVEIQY